MHTEEEKTGHTPGPYVVGVLEGTETLCVATEGGGVIAIMGGAPRRWIEKDADLLAAAPDLLEAARLAEAPICNADAHDDEKIEAVMLLQAAIAKAKGLSS